MNPLGDQPLGTFMGPNSGGYTQPAPYEAPYPTWWNPNTGSMSSTDPNATAPTPGLPANEWWNPNTGTMSATDPNAAPPGTANQPLTGNIDPSVAGGMTGTINPSVLSSPPPSTAGGFTPNQQPMGQNPEWGNPYAPNLGAAATFAGGYQGLSTPQQAMVTELQNPNGTTVQGNQPDLTGISEGFGSGWGMGTPQVPNPTSFSSGGP